MVSFLSAKSLHDRPSNFSPRRLSHGIATGWAAQRGRQGNSRRLVGRSRARTLGRTSDHSPARVPNSLSNIAPEPCAGVSVLDRVAVIVGFAVVLAVLYFGRGVLIPLTVALMLSQLITPLVRALRRAGLGQTTSVLAAALASALAFMATAALIGAQFLRMAESLPRYEETIQQKQWKTLSQACWLLCWPCGESYHWLGIRSCVPRTLRKRMQARMIRLVP